MIRTLFLAACAALALAGCGGGSGGGGQIEACGLITDPRTVFGREVTATELGGIDTIAGGCHWEAADGSVVAETVVYTAGSTRNWRDGDAAALVLRTIGEWHDRTYESPVTLDGVGDEARLIASMPGDNAQIAMRAHERVYVLMANSTDRRTSSEAIARRLANALAAAAPAAP